MIGGFFDNNPTFTYVKVKGLTIIYNNYPYAIMDMYTNCKYLYWDLSSPNALIETNIRPTESASVFLVCINKDGIHTQVPHDELIYDFGVKGTGGDDFASSSEFNALKTQVGENSTKYSSLSNTVNGMAQIIGDESKLEDGTIIQNLSTIKTNSNSITAKVDKMETDYSEDTESKELRDETSSKLISLLVSLSTFHSDFSSVAKKTEVEEGDIPQLQEDLANVNESLSDFETTKDKIINKLGKNAENNDYIDELEVAFNNVKVKVNSLNSICNSGFSDGSISANDITMIITSTGDTIEKVNILKATCDEIMVLGLGGNVYESFSELQMTNDRVQITVSEVYETKKDANSKNETVSKKMSDIELTLEGITSRVSNVEGKYDKMLKSSKTMYYLSSSRTELKDGEWKESQSQQVGRYIWLKMVYEYSDGSTSESTPVCIQGADGDAVEGAVLYTWIKYADDDKGANMSNYPTDKAYIGFAYNQSTATESNNPDDYAWSRMLGEKGDTGVKGDDGSTYYTWIKYSDKANGNPCYDEPKESTEYIGIAINQTTATESSDYTRYTWSKFKGDQGVKGDKGDDGKGVSNVINYYLATPLDSGVTTSTSGWTTEMQNVTEDNKYLWNYERVTYTDGKSFDTTPCIIGNYAKDGDDGKGIKSIVEYYQLSNDNTNPPTKWGTTVLTTTEDNKYLWNYEVITYTDDTTYESGKRVIGSYGKIGKDGKGISSVVNYYLATSLDKGVTTSTKGWTTDIQTPTEDNKYLWNYEKVTYTDNGYVDTEPCIIGNYAEDGTEGKGIESIIEYYQISNDNINPPTTWKTTVQTATEDNRYLWNYEVINYTDGTNYESERRVIGSYGKAGSKGQSLISSTPEYYLSTSASTQTGGSWSETMPTMTIGKYMWSRFRLVWENPSNITYTAPVLDKICETIKGVDEHLSEVEQTANKISWLVKSGTSESNMVMTDSALKIIANNIDLTGKVNFNSLDSTTQSTLNRINDWSYNGTTIDGSKIETNTITASQIAVGDFTNYFTKVYNSNFQSANSGGMIDGYVIRNDGQGENNYQHISLTGKIYSFTGGEKFRITGKIKTGTNTPSTGLEFRVQGSWRDADGNVVSGGSTTLSHTTKTADYNWSTFNDVLTVADKPASASYYSVKTYISDSTVGRVHLQAFTMRRMATGELIVDGSVTAEKIHADAINGKTIIGATIKNNASNPTFQILDNGNTKIGGTTGYTVKGFERAKCEITSNGTLYSVSEKNGKIYTILEEGTLTLSSPDNINGNPSDTITTTLADGGIQIGDLQIGNRFIGTYSNSGQIVFDRPFYGNNWVYSASYMEAESGFRGIGIKSTGTELVLACNDASLTSSDAYSARIKFRLSDGNYYFNPHSNGATRLGSSSYKWASIWCSQSALNTSSDRREKTDISYYDEDDRFEKMFMELKPCVFQKTDSEFGRHHSGFIAQEVEEAMENNDLDYTDFGALLKTPVDKDGEELNVNNEEQMARFVDYKYGLRYGEFTALNTHMIQKAHKEIDELKETVKQQQAMIEQQQKMIDELMRAIKKD